MYHTSWTCWMSVILRAKICRFYVYLAAKENQIKSGDFVRPNTTPFYILPVNPPYHV